MLALQTFHVNSVSRQEETSATLRDSWEAQLETAAFVVLLENSGDVDGRPVWHWYAALCSVTVVSAIVTLGTTGSFLHYRRS